MQEMYSKKNHLITLHVAFQKKINRWALGLLYCLKATFPFVLSFLLGISFLMMTLSLFLEYLMTFFDAYKEGTVPMMKSKQYQVTIFQLPSGFFTFKFIEVH